MRAAATLMTGLLLVSCSGKSSRTTPATTPPTLAQNEITKALILTRSLPSARLVYRTNAGSGTGVVDFTNDNAQMAEQNADADQAIFAGDAAYVSVLLREGNPRPWQRWSRTSQSLLARRPDLVDPARMFDYVAAAGGALSSLGAEQGSGETMQHFRTTVNIKDAAGRATTGLSHAFRGEEAAAGISSVKLNVWVDSQGRVRRIDASPSVSPTTSTTAPPPPGRPNPPSSVD